MALLNETEQQYYNGNNFGGYQFTPLRDIISQFKVSYVGEDKVIPKVKRTEIAFHAQRALQELSFDTLKSIKAQEIEVPASLQMVLPQDYVNYTKVSFVDSSGIKHVLYPASKTSNPSNPVQDNSGNYKLLATGTFTAGSDTIVLDKEYSNIKCGMIVKSSHVPSGFATIYEFSSDGTNTTIKLADFAPSSFNQFANLTAFSSLESGGFDIEIANADGSLINSSNSSYTAIGLTPVSADNFITVSSTDASNIKVGMIVAANTNTFIPENTVVTAVNGTKITISNTTVAPTPNVFNVNFISTVSDSDAWSNYKSSTPSENNNDDYEDDTYWPMHGNRYGIDPQHAQVNGSFYIDELTGKIHFSSNISGKTVILDYISDSLGTEEEMQVHKFAEDAMYKCIAYAILSSRTNVQEYVVQRFKKERFAAVRTAKLRLSNIKLEELTQILRGKSKQIKH
jgi:hypothetical protein